MNEKYTYEEWLQIMRNRKRNKVKKVVEKIEETLLQKIVALLLFSVGLLIIYVSKDDATMSILVFLIAISLMVYPRNVLVI